nr:reverse transcriptase domain-containing protein [Tanacetum cinerariifolium]
MKLSCEWKLFTDGAGSSKGSGVGLMLIDPEGKEYTYDLRFEFGTINNEAEYEALLVGLRIPQEMEIKSLAIFVDSQLLVNQIKGNYVAKQSTIKEYLQKTKEALKGFDSYTIEHIRRNQNKKADALSKLASMTFKHLTKEVLVKVLPKRSIEEKEILQKDSYGKCAYSECHEQSARRTRSIFEKEVDKRRGSKEITSIEEAYYRSKLLRHHNEKSSHSIYKIRDFVLLSQNNTWNTHVWQGPHMSPTKKHPVKEIVEDIMLVQVYVNDIIFGSTKKS